MILQRKDTVLCSWTPLGDLISALFHTIHYFNIHMIFYWYLWSMTLIVSKYSQRCSQSAREFNWPGLGLKIEQNTSVSFLPLIYGRELCGGQFKGHQQCEGHHVPLCNLHICINNSTSTYPRYTWEVLGEQSLHRSPNFLKSNFSDLFKKSVGCNLWDVFWKICFERYHTTIKPM